MTRGNIAMMSQSELAQALAELSVAAYRGGMPPKSVLRALGEIVALASKGKATKASAKRTRVTKRTIKGHAGNGAGAHEEGSAAP
jgi:DNA-binding CsgD family transcriptional regulator